MINLITEFFKVGLFAIGGGLATLPFLYEMADRYPWFTKSMLTDMIAISESTPGPVGVNMATYAGFSAYGVLGGILATLFLVLPSIIIIVIIAGFLKRFKENKFVSYAFYGIRPTVCGLLFYATFQIVKVTLFTSDITFSNFFNFINYKALILSVVLLILIKKIKIHPLFFILCAGIIGIIFKF